ncbi:MAG TPA: hypothetical protein VJU84_14745 [Pyrinomonadaceae bacterium]|nr:hypothetical protein [Pyrinomonadaceae bacterium]
MNELLSLLISLNFLFTLAGGNHTHCEAREFLEYSGDDALCETEMAHLDKYALQVQSDPECMAYIIVYGGIRGTARHEVSQRKARITRYLVKNRGLEPERVRVVEGGFRRKVTVELWLIARGAKLPKPTPTVLPKNVRHKRTKLQFTCSSFY